MSVYREMLLIEEQPSVLLDRLAAYVTHQRWSAVGRLASEDGSMSASG